MAYERIYIEISLRDTREGYWRIQANQNLDPAGHWEASNSWVSVGFDKDDEDDMEQEDEVMGELEATLDGIEYTMDIKSDDEI